MDGFVGESFLLGALVVMPYRGLIEIFMHAFFRHGLPFLFRGPVCILAGSSVLPEAFQESGKNQEEEEENDREE
jgi:hypothetical protein